MAKNNIFIVRHGESENNLLGIESTKLANKDQFDLTKKGISQTKQEAKKHNYFDIIVHSPFKRTKETAKIFAATSNCPLIEEPLLKETDVGGLELQKYSLADEHLQKHGPDVPYPNGESFNQVKVRVSKVLTKLNKLYQGKKILLVTHGDLIEIFVTKSNPNINLSDFYSSHNNGRKVFKIITP